MPLWALGRGLPAREWQPPVGEVAKIHLPKPKEAGMLLSRYPQLAVLEGTRDWISLAEVVGFMARDQIFALLANELAMLVLRELLDEGLVLVGELGLPGFKAWEGDSMALLARALEAAPGLHVGVSTSGCATRRPATPKAS